MAVKSINLVDPSRRIQVAFDYVEVGELSAMIGIASGFGTVRHVLENDPIFQFLLGQAKCVPQVRERILGRIILLSSSEIDPQYAHPQDHPLVSYLWILHQTDEEKAKEGAKHVASAQNLFWARILSRHILMGKPLTIGA